MSKSLTVLLIGLVFLLPLPASADYFFNPHFIISDEEMVDYESMSLRDIQNFLVSKGSSLAFRFLNDYEGNLKRPSEIIWQAAQESKINPKVLLTTLQKEQSLIEHPFPTQNQLDKAMGYRCPDSGSCHPNTLDFGKQVDGAAWQFRQYLDNPQNWTYQAGGTYEIDGIITKPVNTATAGLYNYTPHYSGNNRFWQLWVRYWGKNHPDGSLLKSQDNPGVWLIQYGVRRPITSWGVLVSRFNPNKIITVTQLDLEKWEIGPPIKFTNYSLLQIPTGEIYLLVDNELRHIVSMEVFRNIGFNPEEVELVEELDLSGYIHGRDITFDSAYPTGALLQNKRSSGVYYVENGLKYPIYSREIMDANYYGKLITQVSPEQLDQYPLGSPVKFKDGELIKANNDSKVYVVANGHRRWITTAETFDKLDYKWNNIIVTSQQAIEIHPLGENID